MLADLPIAVILTDTHGKIIHRNNADRRKSRLMKKGARAERP
jgi:ribosomal protein S20